MSKYVITLAMVAVAASAFAQGTVSFANNSSTLVTYQVWNDPPTPVPVGGGFVQLLWAPRGTSTTLYQPGLDPTIWFASNPGWSALTSAQQGIAAIGPLPGRFRGNTVTVPTPTPGATIEAIVAGWLGNFSSLETAYYGSAGIGFSSAFSVTTGNPTSVPPGTPAPITGPGQFTGLNITVVPEPSPVALVALAVPALLVFRRALTWKAETEP